MAGQKWTKYEDYILSTLKQDKRSWKAIGDALGRSEESVRKRYSRLSEVVNPQTKSLEERALDILKQVGSIHISELAKKLNVDKDTELFATLYSLMRESYDISIDSGFVLYEAPDKLKNFVFSDGKEGKLKVALTGDWHLGSKAQQITRLKEFCQLAYDKGVRAILVSGDIFDGTRVFRDQADEIFLHTADEQIEYGAEVIPKYPDLTYYMIAGNHCLGFGAGINPISSLAKQRPDVTYLGKYGAYITINNITIYMHHGLGARTYALSYKMQKFLEKIKSGQEPDIFAQAHYHTLFYAPVRGVDGFEVGSFQGITSFARRIGETDTTVGGWILNIEKTEDGIDFEPFFTRKKPIEHDYPYMSEGSKVYYF